MNVIVLFICGIFVIGIIVYLGWVVYPFVKDPSKINDLFQKATDLTRKESHKTQKQEEYKPSKEEIIRSIVREEIERMGNKIIRSFPQPTNICQSEIVNEIRYNRQLLEHLMVSLDKRQEKVLSESVRPKIQQYPIVKFARMVDNSSPLGFRMASLSDISKGACYQIVINSESQANYRLITDLAIQKEIIAMFNPIITSGCEYDEDPTVLNEIIHIEDGLLELHSEVWQIIKKSKIKFI